jgi:peptidoglycan lytic transglycosylase A
VVAPTFRFTLTLFLAGAAAVILAAILVFGGILPPSFKKQDDDSAFGAPRFEYRIVRFSDLEGWRRDDPEAAFQAFVSSCVKFDAMAASAPANPSENLGDEYSGISISGSAAQWQEICAVAERVGADSYASQVLKLNALRHFFEVEFVPVQFLNRRDPLPDGPAKNTRPRIEETGVFTGYFEPAYSASRVRTDVYSAPVYARPDDLVDVDLGAFREDLAGERIAGRVDGGRLVPYPDHQAINQGALDGKTEPIAWLAPNDLFFLQIQGSGQLTFDDGAQLHIGYAGQNGHPYTAIGRVMVEREVMALKDVSMQSIRQWLGSAAVNEARAMREENASYVFFRRLDGVGAMGPLGAQGVPLTPERSLAVDRRFHVLGAPVWIDIDSVEGNGRRRIQKLMIAQDTGGAIRGPVRGDVFWGAGPRAEQIAGQMNARGRMYVLVPQSVIAQLSARQRR